jgi:hypothetical protein
MAELEFVGYDSAGDELEAPQGANTYVAKKAVRFEQPFTADQPINGRRVEVDGAKLDLITVTNPTDLDAIAAALLGLGSPVVLKGVWNPLSGVFPTSTVAGESWIVSATGAMAGVDFTVNDRVLAIVDGASTLVYPDEWLKLDYSDMVSSVAGRTGNIVLTEADITDLGNYLNNSDIDTLAELNTIVTDATLVDINDLLQPGYVVPPTLVNAATYALLDVDKLLHVAYTATGACAITLMTDQVVSGRFLTIKNAGGSFNLTLDCEGAETIDGETTLIITGSYDAVNLYSDGTNWFIY